MFPCFGQDASLFLTDISEDEQSSALAKVPASKPAKVPAIKPAGARTSMRLIVVDDSADELSAGEFSDGNDSADCY